MSAPTTVTAAPNCAVHDSGMGSAPFQTSGASLDITMMRLDADGAEASGPEEMLAVLEGRVRLVCPEEAHDLKAGQGVLIPADVPHRLEVQAPALLYRVRAK